MKIKMKMKMHTGFWWESQKERDHQEGANVGGRIILEKSTGKYNGMMWAELVWPGCQ
jgi:hypothetical protein